MPLRLPADVHRAFVALVVAACTACASAQAAPPASDVRRAPSLPAVAIAQRLSGARGLPDLTGAALDDAHRRLAVLGARIQVVAFDAVATVSAQYPEPGAPLPADRLVTVWVGVPPAPPPAPATPPPAPAVAAPAPPPAPPAPPATARAAAQGSPASEDPTPAAPRAAPAAPAGATLRGPASWYGAEFAGRRTACGQRFDPAARTLASRELRCGTVVVVSGPGGASVEATVTDWGPAPWTRRRFDLSQATFAAIAPLGAGVVPVSVQIVD